ncbi:MAG: GNAT family N-acetyltransferase [Phycicoccus sp.]|nr:GNAT family N-acetyltransferase [Phycicoccus sp.]NMM34517.1 GNAT family N-acetyltransferase [Phycicoccus sp.]
MLRTKSPVRALTAADRDQALEVCARDTRTNVFVAARILEGALVTSPGALLGYADGSGLQAICWASANLVPVGCDIVALEAFATKLDHWRRRCSSVFGPADMVLPLWAELRPTWGRPREVRKNQPVMATAGPVPPDVSHDPAVRRARFDEVDLVMPAAAAMFTEEIGYPPYWGSGQIYRQSVAALISAGHTFVRVVDGEVMFKADVGSVALGVAQIQGVWVAPRWRGQGLAAPAMASVVEQVRAEIAPVVTLYVNDFNLAARATYARVGFSEIGSFATVLL